MIAYARGGHGTTYSHEPQPTVHHMGHGGDAYWKASGLQGSSGVVIVRYEKPHTRCAICPRGSIALAGSTAVSDCMCNTGWTGSGDRCSQCIVGTYKQGRGNSTCQPCHANAMTEYAGATSSGFCECQASLGWSLKQRERDCFYYIIKQTYDVGLHSRRHPMEFDAGTRPFASFDSPSSYLTRRRERRVCVCVCVFTCVIFKIEYIVYICIQTFPLCVLAFCGHLYQPSLPCFSDELATACVTLMLTGMHFCIFLSC